MTRKSPLTVTYGDLLKLARFRLSKTKRLHKAKKAQGAPNLNGFTKMLACDRQLVKMLESCEPGKQADMFQLFQSVTK